LGTHTLECLHDPEFNWALVLRHRARERRSRLLLSSSVIRGLIASVETRCAMAAELHLADPDRGLPPPPTENPKQGPAPSRTGPLRQLGLVAALSHRRTASAHDAPKRAR
jgi:hypothetical protein